MRAEGRFGSTTRLQTLANWSPTLVISGTGNGQVVANGDTFTFDGTGSNTENIQYTGALGGSSSVNLFSPSTGIGLISLSSAQTAPVAITGSSSRTMRLGNGAGVSVANGAGALTFEGASSTNKFTINLEHFK